MELECCCCWSCYILLLIPLYYLIKYFYELPKVRDLSSKAVLITGCDSGLGRMLALKCAEKGMTVFAGCTTKEVRLSILH
ncbi:unnamed protein product [Anisakis simplex]|uniref:Estradiol 17-beta-dehydrogenase 2 n=1 Tax=Anisakis simplex TaxID=6269 RepID=A0A0M3J246_ANISI|nr:unnamed protein product [Anisakis simplex]